MAGGYQHTRHTRHHSGSLHTAASAALLVIDYFKRHVFFVPTQKSCVPRSVVVIDLCTDLHKLVGSLE